MKKILKTVQLINRRLKEKERQAREKNDVSIYVKYWNQKWHILREYTVMMEELSRHYTQKQIARKLRIDQSAVSMRLRRLGLRAKSPYTY